MKNTRHRGTCTLLLLYFAILSAPAIATESGIVWTNFYNTKAIGNTLVRSSDCEDCIFGAFSKQQIASGDGLVEFTVADADKYVIAGLINPETIESESDIDFGITIRNGLAEIREEGVLQKGVAVASEDTFTVSIEAGLVHYYQNGDRIFTSDAQPDYPLVFVGVLGENLAEVSNALVSSSAEVLWKEMKNIELAGSTLKKRDDCVDCSDSVAISKQAIDGGGGSIEFTVDTLSDLYVGLHSVESGSQPNQFGLTISGGVARPSPALATPAQVSARIGDVFRISIENGHIVYYRNDVFFATAPAELSYPYAFYASLLGPGSSLSNARIVGADDSDTGGEYPEGGNWHFTPSCGLDTGNTYIPVDYDMAPPPVGVKFMDPIFGCPITRLSDGMATYNVNVRHQYSSISPFNSDNSMILLEAGNGRALIVDRQGNVVVPPEELGITSGDEPIWDVEVPSVVYYHRDNLIMVYEVFSKMRMTLYTFSQYSSISFGGGEGDISEDGDHIIVVGDSRFAHVFQGTVRKVSKALDTGGRGFDWIDMTPDNNVLVLWRQSGAGRYRGMELYDGNMNFIRQVIPFVGHADRGRDINGDEIVVMMSSNDLNPLPECAGSGVIKIRLSDSRKTCLMRLTWWQGGHVSLNNSGGHPWVLVSNTEYFNGTAKAAAELPANWADGWGVNFNELAMVKLDGSRIVRLAHHRSRVQDAYIHMPRAAISRDGRYVLFDSNFARQPVQEYTDVYLLDTGN